MDDVLKVSFGDETFRFEPGDEARFGRGEALEIPLIDGRKPDLSLHRHAGTLFFDRVWWLENPAGTGRKIPIVAESAAGSVEVVAAGLAPLPIGNGVLRLRSATRDYELGYESADVQGPGGSILDGQVTEDVFSLTPRQVDFLVSLALPELERSSAPRPSIKEVAALWGVRPKSVENTLRRLRDRFHASGVDGLVDDEFADGGGHNTGATGRLVRFAVERRLVDSRDLDWAAIDAPDGPRPAGSGPRFART